ncbi:MAG: pyrroline-5-carboxylate reductase [Pirellulaceae bacterium]|nr:MAG: pyrroline-5-carboxylate reductase [Pirellulaceae bacterium]
MEITPVGFMGAGQMARALAAGIFRAGVVSADAIFAYDPAETATEAFAKAIPGSRILPSPERLAAECRSIVLAVKPQHAQPACRSLAPYLADQLIISVMAGIRLSQMAEWLGTRRLVRVMPNTPCLVSKGASAFATDVQVDDGEIQWVERLLRSVGYTVSLPEPLLDAVTGLSGSGPAFVAVFLEALADGGVRAGLPRTVAWQLAVHTVRGTAELLLQSGQHPATLKDQVASPAGTTIAGLAVIERSAVRGAILDAVMAAAERAAQLGRESSA